MRLLVALVVMLIVSTAAAEPAQIAGKVTWLSGARLTLGVPVQNFGQRGSITLDLSDVPQSDVQDIRSGDQVIVYGELVDGRFVATRVIVRR